MDGLIARFDAEQDKDLMLCMSRGIAYQREMKVRADYGQAYFDKCRGYEDQEIARKINAGRVALVNKYVGDRRVLDIGIGSGEFIKKRGIEITWGHDVNPVALKWLQKVERIASDWSKFAGYTFWDVLEHVEHPQHYLRAIPPGSHLFACLPIFSDLRRIRESKHYRPGEHLYYWTERGFVDWLALYQFRLLERADFETAAGRESIVSFAFVRDLPGYHDTVEQYRKLYTPFYGSTAYLYFDQIALEVMTLKPVSILDYGCGRSDLVAHFWADGRRRIAKYDPAVPNHETMPEGQFDLVLCTDVMEHILMSDVDKVLAEIREKSSRVLFTISLRPARAKLPDGRNAHVTLLNEGEWKRWIKSVFGYALKIPTQWDHILMLRTW